MLVIRHDQMEVFRVLAFERYIRRETERVRATIMAQGGSAILDPEALPEFVRHVVGMARDYQIRAEDNLRFFLDLAVAEGLEFTREPTVRRLLESAMDETEKVNQLSEYFIFGHGG